jgi:hypothetical protein
VRQGPLWIVEPPLSTSEEMSVNDPSETVVSLHSGRSESHLITLSAREDRRRNFDAKCLRGFEVDTNIESGQVSDRKAFRVRGLANSFDAARRTGIPKSHHFCHRQDK